MGAFFVAIFLIIHPEYMSGHEHGQSFRKLNDCIEYARHVKETSNIPIMAYCVPVSRQEDV